MCHTSHYWHRRDRWTEGGLDPIEHERIAADPPAAEPARDPDLRVSQAERDEVATELARHFADGRLTVDEYEERVGAALAARTGHDLQRLLADLPAREPAAASPRPVAHPRRLPARSGWPTARVIAIAAVVVLAIATGPWALWLLWPAFVFTGPCGRSVSHRSRLDTRVTHRRPVATQRL